MWSPDTLVRLALDKREHSHLLTQQDIRDFTILRYQPIPSKDVMKWGIRLPLCFLHLHFQGFGLTRKWIWLLWQCTPQQNYCDCCIAAVRTRGTLDLSAQAKDYLSAIATKRFGWYQYCYRVLRSEVEIIIKLLLSHTAWTILAYSTFI